MENCNHGENCRKRVKNEGTTAKEQKKNLVDKVGVRVTNAHQEQVSDVKVSSSDYNNGHKIDNTKKYNKDCNRDVSVRSVWAKRNGVAHRQNQKQ